MTTPTDDPRGDEQFFRLLAEYDEARGRGGPAPPSGVPPASLPRWRAAVRCLDLLARAAPAPATPRRVGRFVLRRELGRGGFGVVYLAEDPRLGRLVALKVPRPELPWTDERRRRFLREAEAAAPLDHPGLVPLYEAGEADGVCYLASAYCEGPTLAAWLRGRDALVEVSAAAALVAALADAAHHAHERGVVHRDLKPANVLLQREPDGVGVFHGLSPRVTDFGLAKVLPAAGDPTASGAVLGTPAYLSPEQAEGRANRVGPATDVWALGVILYELLTGRPPFPGDTALDVLRRVATDEPVPPSRLRSRCPADLETVCLKCLRKEPAHRYQTAAELADDLRRFLGGKPVRARPVGPAGRAARWARRHPAWAALLLVSVAAAVALAAGVGYHVLRLGEALEESRKAHAEASAQERRAREVLYAADLKIAHQLYWNSGQAGPALELLQRYDPAAGAAEDLRGFEWRYLRALCNRAEARALRGHVGEVYAVAFDPKGGTLASAGADGTVQLWEPGTGRPPKVLRGHGVAVCWLAFAADGSLLGAAADGSVGAWDPAGVERGSLRSLPAPPSAVAFSPDGRYVASPVRDGGVRVAEVATGNERVVLRDRFHSISSLRFAPAGTVLVVTEEGGFTSVWSWEEGKLAQPRLSHYHTVLGTAFSPNGRRLALADAGGQVRDWRLGGEAETLSGHHGPVRAAAFSPDGQVLATAGDDAAVRFWDARARTPAAVGKGHVGPVECLAFSPDGTTLASGGRDGTVRLWDRDPGEDFRRLGGSLEPAGPFAFAPDGQALAVACLDGRVRVLDPATAQVRQTLAGLGSPALAVAFTAAGRVVAADAWEARSWDAATGGCVAVHPGPPGPTRCAALSPDGRRLARAGRDRLVRLLDLATGQESPLAGHAEEPTCLAFSPDGGTLASTGPDETVRVWDVAGGRERACFKADAPAALAFRPDGQALAVGSQVGSLAAYDLATGGRLFGQSEGINDNTAALAYRPDGAALVVTTGERVLLRGAARGELRGLVHADSLGSLAAGFSPDGKTLVTTGRDGTVRLWDPATWARREPAGQPPRPVAGLGFAGATLVVCGRAPADRARRQLSPSVCYDWWCDEGEAGEGVRLWDPGSNRSAALPGDDAGAARACCLGMTSAGRTLAVGATNGTVAVWDLPGRKRRLTVAVSDRARAGGPAWDALSRQSLPMLEPDAPVAAVALSPGGGLLATACEEQVRLWDAADGSLRLTLGGPHERAGCVAFSPDGRTVATNDGGRVRLYDAATGQPGPTLAADEATVLALAYSADGRLLATAGREGRVRLWDAATGAAVATLAGHTDAAAAVAFSPDGRTLASGGWDGTVRLWSVPVAQEVLTLAGHKGKVTALAFAPDGTALASGGKTPADAGEVLLWPAVP
jgi:WD40 repeat protein